MTPLRAVLTIVALVVIVALVSRLPDDVFGATQTSLLVAAGLALLLAGAATLLAPARRLLAATFSAPLSPEPAGVVFGIIPPDDVRALLRPVLAALLALAVAGGAAMLRG